MDCHGKPETLVRDKNDSGWKRWGVIAAVIFLLGGVVGVSSGLLGLMLSGVERLMLGYVENPQDPSPYKVAAWRRIASIVGGSVFAAVVWWLLRTKTTKVPSVKIAVAGERMPVWQTTVHVLLQIFIVGSGSSIGREVAPREFGAMLGQRFSQLFRLNDEKDRRTVVAVAAAAGLAGVYNAPLAGTFFALEILLADISMETVTMALGTSAVSAYIASMIRGRGTFYGMAAMGNSAIPTLSLTLFAILAGIICGVSGALFRKGSQWAEGNKPKGAGILWMMPLAALATGVVAIWLPQVMGNGRSVAQYAFSSTAREAHALVPVLLALLVAKVVLTLGTIRSGASGGVLQPGISIGATVGALLGFAWVIVSPGDTVTACALVGASALLAASQQAPLMAMCLVMELTGAPMAFFVPVGVGVAVSALVSRGFNVLVSRSERKSAGPVV
ncbi:chloride channel protein [Bifidobacterium sp. ESL0790]|uniref:chloride channel protein n=1 Tax=Bifidobacterium sp. ESL0790 TaxID=2983233 RepID=UPI0023F8B1CC|nr:chloride channel protein [Bifidobacterium sp. ESL0790]WEV72963.1 chloride channel protein [Bifidobacterium sp. ESL0790]